MAGKLRVLIGLALFAAAPAFGQTAATPEPAAASTPSPEKRPGAWLRALRKGANGTPSPEFQNVRKALEALTPEQRKRFQENVQRWANLAPEQKRTLRDREEARKKLMQQQVDAAIQESGLQLDAGRRERFFQRYAEERRKIEEQLRREMAEKRKPLVRDLIARLKQEFASPPATAPAAGAVQ